ncbi:hypothetical protein ClosIBUN13A_CONTIG124g01988 [Clostridium sp. IBUN13A]|nr:hypothetical protein ClosIBUN22A_CONTIG79g01813 [Clostridium sp. IBUN22A]KJZ87980.1 hypothetical protein ClosIBUN125C_CONTIG28g01561 [Clostridium sp. IBUN125C]KJZ94948.1 hypothetical protein ClosIBUN62F_CONTIG20g00888 [Clostridium sp. IBUN62F]KJZ97209.1 hypothetical protein ClosIBUN13A_CONTIG124g01988 [Clostridium sp. IBUN13A]
MKRGGLILATTVDQAFIEFLKDKVNLDPNITTKARSSRDNLIENIKGFSGDDDFFTTYNDRILKFGSFAKKTKIRELDDIDMMFCLSADGRTYTELTDGFEINGVQADKDNSLCIDDTYKLNSTKVINRFISKLEELNDYKKSDMKKNHEAATLQLKSYTWNFDIVPCFYTTSDIYLIPDGKGNWKKTDPRIDADNVSTINQKHKGKVLNVIRLTKYWNRYNSTVTITSYLLETMILNYYNNLIESENYWVDLEFKNVLQYLSNEILNDVADPKGIQGNINLFSIDDRLKISKKAKDCYDKACEASTSELTDKDQESAINKWGEILGDEFPKYEE